MSLAQRRKAGIRRLLEGIQTGDPHAVEVIHPTRYIQHNPQTHEGREGLAALFARLAKTNPRVNLVRVFSDGDFVFAHTEYDFATRRIGFEIFRFEGESTVEHWDNIQPRLGPNAAGRSMVDGPAEATQLDGSEDTRRRARAFVEEVFIGGKLAACGAYLSGDELIQHHPEFVDGGAALRAWLGREDIVHQRVHRVLAEGNFALVVCEGLRSGTQTAFFHLFRTEGEAIAEHWSTIEGVAPPSEWKHDNGKF